MKRPRRQRNRIFKPFQSKAQTKIPYSLAIIAFGGKPQARTEIRSTIVIVDSRMKLVDLLRLRAPRKHLYIYFPGYSIALHTVLHAIAQFHCKRNCPSVHSSEYFSALNTESTKAKKWVASSSLSTPHLHAKIYLISIIRHYWIQESPGCITPSTSSALF